MNAPRMRVVQELAIPSTDVAPFTRPYAFARDRRGNLWVTELEEHTVYVFDSTGRFLGRHGRRGRGPGEFETPAFMGMLGDSVWVSDEGLRRVVWFGFDGKHLHTEPWSSPMHPPLMPGAIRAVFSDGTGAALAQVFAQSLGDGSVTALPLFHLSPDGAVLDTLATLSDHHSTLMLRSADRQTFTGQPFGGSDTAAAFPDGSGIVVVTMVLDHESGTVPVKVSRMSPDGVVRWTRTLELGATPVRGAEVDSAVSDIAASFRGYGASYTESDVRKVLFVPRFHWPVDGLLASADGSVLMKRSIPEHGQRVWLVLDPQGVPSVTFAVDTAVSLRWADGHHLWGVRRDSLDVPTLVRYRLAAP
ncbi:MAG TPA: 6-bladed beta-propeller [Gemmatimonadaceae bacterium]|nr:6-bladed beta-propeller [Gemmatimonadaceae bacterium]